MSRIRSQYLKNLKIGANWRANKGTLSDCSTSIIAKHHKIEGVPFAEIFYEKSLTMPKKLKGGPFSLTQYCMLRWKTGKTFLVQFARPNGSVDVTASSGTAISTDFATRHVQKFCQKFVQI